MRRPDIGHVPCVGASASAVGQQIPRKTFTPLNKPSWIRDIRSPAIFPAPAKCRRKNFGGLAEKPIGLRWTKRTPNGWNFIIGRWRISSLAAEPGGATLDQPTPSGFSSAPGAEFPVGSKPSTGCFTRFSSKIGFLSNRSRQRLSKRNRGGAASGRDRCVCPAPFHLG
jgi:hypothetical protein